MAFLRTEGKTTSLRLQKKSLSGLIAALGPTTVPGVSMPTPRRLEATLSGGQSDVLGIGPFGCKRAFYFKRVRLLVRRLPPQN